MNMVFYVNVCFTRMTEIEISELLYRFLILVIRLNTNRRCSVDLYSLEDHIHSVIVTISLCGRVGDSRTKIWGNYYLFIPTCR